VFRLVSLGLAVSIALCRASLFAAESSTENLLDYKTIRSHSRRFVAVATDGKQGLDVVKWTESVADRLERMTELRWPATSWWSFSVSVRNETGPDSNLVYTAQSFEHGRFKQRLVINNYQAADVRETEEKLCRLLLNAAVVRAQLGTSDGALSGAGLRALRESRQLHVAPEWLARGLSQNLHWRVRAANSRTAVGRRMHGKLPDLGTFLSAPSTGSCKSADPVMCGLAVGWLLSLPHERHAFPLLVRHLAEGHAVSPEWVAVTIAGCASADELGGVWDAWIDRQRRTVYKPGETVDHDLRLLDAELLLSAGASGIPLQNMPAGKLGLREMIAYRNAPWIAAFAARKSAELRVLAVARGPELAEVVDHYCRFLMALKNGRTEQELVPMLGIAEGAHDTLARQVAAERHGNREGDGLRPQDTGRE